MALARRAGSNRLSTSIWPGFVDAMTALLLVLMFVLSIFMIVQFMLRETISGQESELDQLNAQVANLGRALGLAQDRNTQLRSEVGALNADLRGREAEAERQSRLIDTLTVNLQARNAELASAQGEIDAFQAQVAALIVERDRAQAAQADLGAALAQAEATAARRAEALAAAEASAADQAAALASLRSETDAQTEAARLAAAQAAALEALVAEMETERADQTAQLAALAAERDALQTQLSEDETARLAQAAAQALQARLANAEDELTAMTLALEAQRARAEETLTLLAAAQSAEADLDDQLAAALLDRLALEERLTDATGDASTLRGEVSALQAEQARLREALAAAEAERARMVAALAEARSGTEDRAVALAAAEGRITELTTALNTAEQDRARLSAALGEATDGASTSARDLAAARSEIAALDQALTDERTRTAELATLVTQAQTQTASDAARLAEAEVTIEALSADLAGLRTDVLRLTSENQSLRAATGDAEDVRRQLAAALAAKLQAEESRELALSLSEQRAALLSAANRQLATEEAESAESRRRMAVLNEQVAALRSQLGSLQALLDAADARDADAQVELQALGNRLNTALAQVASEQRRRADLEAAERARLEAEAKRLAEEAQNLESYRSEFFGTLRQLLSGREGVRIEGDRFVFSSEVLFEPGSATLSPAGQRAIQRVVSTLSDVAGQIPQGIDWVIRVDGHTDNVPLSGTGQFRDNWELSQGRALSVVRFMTDALGFPPDRLAANGFGEYQPINLDDTPEARAQNRRIELKLTER